MELEDLSHIFLLILSIISLFLLVISIQLYNLTYREQPSKPLSTVKRNNK